MNRLFYSPNVSVGAGGDLVTEKKEVKKKANLPTSNDDFKATAQRVCNSWKANSAITLLWVTQEGMQEEVNIYAADLAQRKSIGGERPSITSTLQLLNIDINAAVTEVKVYIEKKYKKLNAKPQFARFGIVKQNDSYVLPGDHNARLENLDLMIAAISKDGFADEEYGVQFWMDVKKRFSAALQEASNTDGSVSGKVSGKNVSRKKLLKIMIALRKVIMGNYPDTYPSVFREWGWQKNDY